MRKEENNKEKYFKAADNEIEFFKKQHNLKTDQEAADFLKNRIQRRIECTQGG